MPLLTIGKNMDNRVREQARKQACKRVIDDTYLTELCEGSSMMSTEIILTFAILGVTIFLFVSELLRVDVVALCVMLALPWLGLVEPREALAGLSSNAVFSIIGVMILGYGMDRSGIMTKVTRPILRVAGSSERRLVGLVTFAVGAISAFMQNIGAAALFLPALLRISKRTKIPESRLLMPVGFGAILGGTLTMVASGPLIILNDILRQGGQASFGLFAVTPVGLILLIAGILYFLILGPAVLPGRKGRGDETSPQQELVDAWNLASQVTTATVTDQSLLVGKHVAGGRRRPARSLAPDPLHRRARACTVGGERSD
jgi:Na+/H+ antiporter NhaD/arsenite permease-like protein